MSNNSNNNDITSFLDFPIIINAHEHPLLLCYCQRQNGWSCDKCSRDYNNNTPSFYCSYCDYDLCQNCLGEYKLNQIKKYNSRNNSNNFKTIRNDSNKVFSWQIKTSNHTHLLSLIKNINNSSWDCNKCRKSYKNNINSYYCSLCNYYLCDKCYNNNSIKDSFIKKKSHEDIEFSKCCNNSDCDDNCSITKDNNNISLPLPLYKSKPTICTSNKIEIIENLLEEGKYNTNTNEDFKCCDYSDDEDSYYVPKQRDDKPRIRIHRPNRKPVIYLYPEKEQDISVQLNINLENSKFTAIYPKFNEKNNIWNVHAKPNGDIKLGNKIYPYLFWEANSYFMHEMNEGFIVKDENAEEFLEEKLKILGLNDKESTDFITYWLPVLLKNKLSLCSFQGEKFFNNFKLNINPKPDTMIRVFLAIKKINSPINIKEQKLEKKERNGYTVIEWGGSDF